MMLKDPVVCPICGKENFGALPKVEWGQPYKEGSCNHRYWDAITYPDLDIVTKFLKNEKNNPPIKVPEFHSLNLDAIPKETLDSHRESLLKNFREKLHEVDGWWFATLEEREALAKELAVFLKPLFEQKK